MKASKIRAFKQPIQYMFLILIAAGLTACSTQREVTPANGHQTGGDVSKDERWWCIATQSDTPKWAHSTDGGTVWTVVSEDTVPNAFVRDVKKARNDLEHPSDVLALIFTTDQMHK